MKKAINKIKNSLTDITRFAITFLCFGVVVQLIVGSPLLGWDVIGNISDSIRSVGQSSVIGIIALLVLYSLFVKIKVTEE